MTDEVDAEPVTKVIVDRVRPDRVDQFEAWADGINAAVHDFDGYMGVEVFRPRDPADPEYVTIVRFDTAEHLRAWERSPECQGWLAAANEFIVRTETSKAQGIELWFSLPQRLRRSRPAVWKSVLTSAFAVYALLLLFEFALDPHLDDLHPRLALGISVIILSALLTWPVLPYLTKALDAWLYPEPAAASEPGPRVWRRN